MDDPSLDPVAGIDTGGGPHAGYRPRPRWLKAFMIIGAVIVVVLLAMVLLGGGEHGPGRHMGGSGGHHPPAIVTSGRPGPGGGR